MDYIESTPLKNIPACRIREALKTLMQLEFGLTETEIIQIVNLCPVSDVEFYLVGSTLLLLARHHFL